MKSLLCFIILLITITSTHAQIKEAAVFYDVKLEGLPPEQAAMIGEMNLFLKFKNEKMILDLNSELYSLKLLSDENGITLLIDVLGQKTAIKQSRTEIEKQEAGGRDRFGDARIEYVDETKMTAGYLCKKALVTVRDKDQKESKSEVWYCDKFENPNKKGRGEGLGIMKGIKGLVFEYSTVMGTMKMKMTAREVFLEPLADSTFSLSTEGYKLNTAQ